MSRNKGQSSPIKGEDNRGTVANCIVANRIIIAICNSKLRKKTTQHIQPEGPKIKGTLRLPKRITPMV